MLHQIILDRIAEAIDAYLAPRNRTLPDNLQGALRKLSARGMVGSGNTAVELAQIGSNELKVRARIIWDAIHRAHITAGSPLEDATLRDLQQQLAHHVNAQAAQVRTTTTGAVPNLPRRDPLIEHIESTIATNAREVLAQLNVEAGFYVDELRRQAAQPAPVAAVTINASHIGAVQTGAYAVANVAMAAQDNARLIETLEGLRQALQANAEGTADQRSQGDELAGDLIAAVQVERPNRPKIAGLFGGLATVVQTIASLRPAWDIARDAAIAAGVWAGTMGG